MQSARSGDRNSASILSLAWRRAARLLIAIMATLLLVMPWTESRCHWDNFLRGGQDLELGLLALAALLCLVLLLCLDHGRILHEWFRLCELFFLSNRPTRTPFGHECPAGPLTACVRNALSGPVRCSLPLRI